MNIRPDFPPEGYEFVEKPDDATHVWEHDWSIIDLSVCPCYSRSLRGWLRKLPEPNATTMKQEATSLVDVVVHCEKCGEILEHEKSPYTWQSLGAMILPEDFVEKNVLN